MSVFSQQKPYVRTAITVAHAGHSQVEKCPVTCSFGGVVRVWGRTACARSSADACSSESALWNQWFLLRAIHVRQTHCGQEFQQRFRGCPSLGGRARLPSEVPEIFYSSI